MSCNQDNIESTPVHGAAASSQAGPEELLPPEQTPLPDTLPGDEDDIVPSDVRGVYNVPTEAVHPAEASLPSTPSTDATQIQLSKEARRIGLSGSGTKATLLSRLSSSGVRSYDAILKLFAEWEEHQCATQERGGSAARRVSWRTEETWRLILILGCSESQTTFVSMY